MYGSNYHRISTILHNSLFIILWLYAEETTYLKIMLEIYPTYVNQSISLETYPFRCLVPVQLRFGHQSKHTHVHWYHIQFNNQQRLTLRVCVPWLSKSRIKILIDPWYWINLIRKIFICLHLRSPWPQN